MRPGEGGDWTEAGALGVSTQPTLLSRGTLNTRGSLLGVCLCTSGRGGGEDQVRSRAESRRTERGRDAHPGTETNAFSDAIMCDTLILSSH